MRGGRAARLAVATLLVATLGACGERTDVADPEPPSTGTTAPERPPSTGPDGQPGGPEQPPARPRLRCGSAPLAAAPWGPVEPTLGHRYLPVVVRNCTGAPLRLRAFPVIEARLASGRALPARSTPRGAEREVRLAPRARAWVGVEWLAAARRPAWAEGLTLAVPAVGDAYVVVPALDVNRETAELVVHAWAASPEEIWPQ